MPLSDIRYQDQAVEVLKTNVREGQIPHALMFTGPKGVGKAKAALEFAKFLNCQKAQDDACGRCPSCLKIDAFSHPDVLIMTKDDDRTQIPISKIRELQHRFSLKPFEAQWKVAFIKEAEDMTEEAFNCLLKILEEPGPNTLFILTVSNIRYMPDTIVSRCQVVRFKALTRDQVKAILINDFHIGEKEAGFLSAISGGDLSSALRFKEKDAVLWKNAIIDAFISEGTDSIARDTKDLFEGNRQDKIEALDILLGFYRDVLVYTFTQDPDIVINTDRIDTISDLSKTSDVEKVQGYMRDIEETKDALMSNANAKLAIKVLGERLSI